MSAPSDREESIFEQALGIASPEARNAYLRDACGDDAAMLGRLRGLLGAHDRAGRFLEHQESRPGAPVFPQAGVADADRAASDQPVPAPSEQPGDRIGRYKLLEQIGEGGMGVVWMAEQEEPVRRRVALKIIKLGMDTRSVVARFEAERQALAMMDHPNIARVFDGGVTGSPLTTDHGPLTTGSGRPYFVMELVRGLPITKYCDEAKLSTRDRLELFGQVCRAVRHAHQKGIIHRDLKPSNILVTEQDGRPMPKVIDFGIAKATEGRLTDKTLFTGFQQWIGTPAYMSPEQAGLGSLDIDTRSDTYSLGVVLYELLTGRPPFDTKELLKQGYDAVLRTIREVDPPKPSTAVERDSKLRVESGESPERRSSLNSQLKLLSTALRGDLDWIVMKCLEKDRNRRYETANGLASDLERYLHDEPVLARPPSALYRWRKFARKHRGSVIAAGAFIVLLAAAAIASTALALWANRERDRAETAKELEAVQRQSAEIERNRAVTAEQGQIKLRQQAETNEKTAKSEAAKSGQVARFLKDMLGGVAPSVALGRDTVMLREILDKTAKRLAKDLKNQPEVEAELRLIIGKTYKELGQYAEALAMTREALRLRQSLFGPESSAVAEALDGLGSVLYDQGDLPGAEEVGRESLALSRKLYGEEHPAVADALNTLGSVLQTRHDLAGAEARHREALAMRKKLLTDQHPNVAGSLNNLANVLFERGDMAGAEESYREALAIFEKRLSPDHPIVTTVTHNLGILASRRGDLDSALAMQRKVLAIRKKNLTDEHPDVAVTLNELAMVLAARGEIAEAEAVVRQALATKSLRPEHWRFTTTLNTLGIILARKGDLAGAETNYVEALALRRKLLSDENPLTTESLNRLAVLRAVRGELSEARAGLRETLTLRKKSQGDSHLDLIPALWPLAWVLAQQGDTAGAEAFRREAVTLSLQGGAYGVWTLLDSIYDVADLLQVQRKFDGAELILKEAFDYLRNERSANAPFRRGAIERLVRLYDAWGKPDPAAEWRRKLTDRATAPANLQP